MISKTQYQTKKEEIKMKKTFLTVIAAALALLTLASCTNGGTGNNGTTDNKPAQSTDKPADSTKDNGTTDPTGSTSAPATDAPTDTTAPITVEVGTVLNYKTAFYLDEATPSSGEKFVQNLSQGFARIDDEFLLNDDDTYQLFWAASQDETFEIPFNIPADGKYNVTLTLFNGGDFGTFQIFIGETLLTSNEGLDCCNKEDGGLKEIDLGDFDLSKGDTKLVVRCMGKSDVSDGTVFAINNIALTAKEVR